MSGSSPGSGQQQVRGPAETGATRQPVGAGSGAILNGAYFAVAAAVSFFLSPFMLRRLGDAPFGLLSVTWELGGYFGLMDLGLRSAVNYYVARTASTGGTEQLRGVIRTAFWLLAGLTMAALAASFPLAWLTAGVIDRGPLDAGTVRLVLWVGFAVFALNLTGSLSAAVLSGLRRFDVQAATNIAGVIGAGLLVFGAIQAKMSLLAVALMQGLGTMLPWAAQQWVLRRWQLTKGLWPPRIRRQEARDLMTFGGANLVMRICELLTFQFDQVLIVQAAGPAPVARYHVGRFLGLHSRSLVSSVSIVLAPYFTALKTGGDEGEMRAFFLRLNRWINSLAALLVAGVLCLGEPFLRLWVGKAYVEGGWWNRSDAVLLLFALAMGVRSLSAVPYQFLLGTRRLRVLTLASIAEALLVVAGGAAAVRWKGIAAVAAVKLAASVLAASGILVPYSLREAGVRAGEYLRRSLAPAMLTAAATAAAGLGMRAMLPLAGWAEFFAAAAVSGAAGAAAFLVAGASEEDREFIRRKLRNPLG